jgi:ribosome-associated translation inhibitor RaiA
VTITTLKSGVVRVEDSEESLYASIDLVCDKVRRLQRERPQMQGFLALWTWQLCQQRLL